MVVARTTVPTWWRVLVIVLLLWELIGCYMCVQQFRLGPDAMPNPSDYDRANYASLPIWYNSAYAVATFGGALAMLALLFRSTLAIPLSLISLIGVVAVFGYYLLATDAVNVKGLVVTYFPLFIFTLSAFMVWLAFKARRRGWIG